jgi:hypothetical protein
VSKAIEHLFYIIMHLQRVEVGVFDDERGASTVILDQCFTELAPNELGFGRRNTFDRISQAIRHFDELRQPLVPLVGSRTIPFKRRYGLISGKREYRDPTYALHRPCLPLSYSTRT